MSRALLLLALLLSGCSWDCAVHRESRWMLPEPAGVCRLEAGT